MKKLTKLMVMSIAVVGILLVAFPTQAVFAQGENPPNSERQQRKERPFRRHPISLERLFERLVDRYEDLGYRIQDQDDVIQRLEARIETLIDVGEDPSELQRIQEAYMTGLEAIEAPYVEVGELIDDHAGFNDDGEVVDEDLALATLEEVAQDLKDVRRLLQDVRFDLHWDLMTYRFKNEPFE